VRPIARPFLLALLLALAPAQAADIDVKVRRNGDVFTVEAHAEFEGSIARTWQVLTDYGRYSEYIPDLTHSRVLSRKGRDVEVEQKGEARLLFLIYPLDVRLAVTEQPYERVSSRAVAGSFREMRNTYFLEAREGRVLLRYTGRLVPDFYLPPVVGTLVLRSTVEAMFVALVEEMERRNAQKPGTGDQGSGTRPIPSGQ
jgi:ribosome-associated toxin RatA of RatAB toxin-antitoxin module